MGDQQGAASASRFRATATCSFSRGVYLPAAQAVPEDAVRPNQLLLVTLGGRE